MKFYIIVAVISSIVLGGASHWVRNYWQDWQDMQLEKVRQTELMANYEQELRLKDLQISLQQDSLEAIEAEVEWARVHVAQREDQIALLREGFSDEVNLCLDTIIDPAFAP